MLCRLQLWVLGRNRTLFCCVFWLRYCVRSVVAPVFSLRVGLICTEKLHQYMYDKSTYRVWASPLTEVLCYSGNAVEICNGIMFDFYPGLPHIYKCIHIPFQQMLTSIWEHHSLFGVDCPQLPCTFVVWILDLYLRNSNFRHSIQHTYTYNG